MKQIQKTKLYTYINFNTPYQKEIVCYWELTNTEAIFREWKTNKEISRKNHFGNYENR